MTVQAWVLEFYQKFRIPFSFSPVVPSEDRVRLKVRLIVEEACEVVAAAFPDRVGLIEAIYDDLNQIISNSEPNVDLVKMADGLADLAYVVEGANLEFGIDSLKVLKVVHDANMKKEGGGSRLDGKVLKPLGWVAPDVLGELKKQGLLLEKK